MHALPCSMLGEAPCSPESECVLDPSEYTDSYRTAAQEKGLYVRTYPSVRRDLTLALGLVGVRQPKPRIDGLLRPDRDGSNRPID